MSDTTTEPVVKLPSKHDTRAIVVANRLPITVTIKSDGEFAVSRSSGGLVSALKGVSGIDCLWMGWPGGEVDPDLQPAVLKKCQEEGSYPVFLDQKTIEYFYNGFCNNILWPLFHYVPPPMDVGTVDTVHEEFSYYLKANEMFTDAIMKACEQYPDDDKPYIWVHDYHLMLVPRMLRDRCPHLRIGWFLHTPWPTHEVFRMLPFRTEILTGLLAANLLAFHVYDYQRHFMQSCRYLLGLEGAADGIDATPVGGGMVKCASIPIGIEPRQFVTMIKDDDVKAHVARLRKQFGEGRKVILGVDRLDYMKGIPHKLNAFDRFLEMYPDWRGKCVLVQLAVPSRSDVPEYQRLKSAVHEMVGKINGRRGGLGFLPIHYLDQSLAFPQLVALYRASDVAFITSLRDGMNLVAFEYVAAQKGRHGVLVLSEFAGASQSLGAGALRLNPWNLDESASVLHQALSMPPDERRTRHDYCFRHVMTHTSQKWAEGFLDSLFDACEEGEEVRAAIPPLLKLDHFIDAIKNASSRLLMVELIDCMVPSKGQRGLAMKQFKSLVQIPQHVHIALQRLASCQSTTLIISSAASPAVMDKLFGGIPAVLVASKGCAFRDLEGKWEDLVLPERLDLEVKSWMPEVHKIVEWVQRRSPGSYIDTTAATITWHWEDLQEDVSQAHARELLVHLWAGPLANVSQGSVDVSLDSKSIEIRPASCSREKLLRQVLDRVIQQAGREWYDFVACLGTYPGSDESIYSLLESMTNPPALMPHSASAKDLAAIGAPDQPAGSPTSRDSDNFFSVTVSGRLSRAKYRMSTVREVQALLVKCGDALSEPNIPGCQEHPTTPPAPREVAEVATPVSSAAPVPGSSYSVPDEGRVVEPRTLQSKRCD